MTRNNDHNGRADKWSVQLGIHQVHTGWEWGKWMKLDGNEQKFIKDKQESLQMWKTNSR